jgi:hypothetical protein
MQCWTGARVKLKGWSVDRVMASLGWGCALTNHLPVLAAEVHCRRANTTESPTPTAPHPDSAFGDDAGPGLIGGDVEEAPAPG